MDKRVLEIITENLTNERLDAIVRGAEEYRQAEQETNRAINILEGMLDEEQQKTLDCYLSAENNRASVYSKISYRQGMKDVLTLLISLIDGQKAGNDNDRLKTKEDVDNIIRLYKATINGYYLAWRDNNANKDYNTMIKGTMDYSLMDKQRTVFEAVLKSM